MLLYPKYFNTILIQELVDKNFVIQCFQYLPLRFYYSISRSHPSRLAFISDIFRFHSKVNIQNKSQGRFNGKQHKKKNKFTQPWRLMNNDLI